MQPASREAYQRLLSQGWIDSLRTLYPERPIYTFWDYFRNHWQTNSGLRIDHVLLSEKLRPGLMAAGVDTWVRGKPHASDHAPTWIEIADDALTGTERSRSKSTSRKKAVRKKISSRQP